MLLREICVFESGDCCAPTVWEEIGGKEEGIFFDR